MSAREVRDLLLPGLYGWFGDDADMEVDHYGGLFVTVGRYGFYITPQSIESETYKTEWASACQALKQAIERDKTK